MTLSRKLLWASACAVVLAGCARDGELVIDQGVGITAVRSVCPAVGVPDYTGDVTLFRTAGDHPQCPQQLQRLGCPGLFRGQF